MASSSNTVRTTISMPGVLFDAATNNKRQQGFGTFSDYIQALIRADQRLGIITPQPQQPCRKAS